MEKPQVSGGTVDARRSFVVKGGMNKVLAPYSDDFLIDYPTVSVENPQRIQSIMDSIAGLVELVDPAPCSSQDLLPCHSARLIGSVEGDREVFPVALMAAGGAVTAARAALQRPSFALIRPPGHHAGRNFNGGFCFFNNMAIAVSSLLRDGVVGSALIVDIDLHYGNGTDDIFRDERRVDFRNISAFNREEFFAEFERSLQDADRFDILACSAGFDTYIHDWGGLLFTDDYRRIGAMMTGANKNFFAILEGGYYIPDLGRNVGAFLRGMLEMC
jgi:acetoin utilization deacetylase AcuC-like enzyme